MAIDKDQILGQIINFIVGLISKEKTAEVSVTIPLGQDAPPSPPPIDWISPASKITEHFTVGDMTMLHEWNRLANDMDGFTDGMKARIIVLCQKMEEVRALLGCPMNVHCGFRSQEYNKQVVKAIPNDVHAMGLAIDFDCNPHMTIDQVKAKLEPELDKLGIRMERGTTTWVHLDLHAVGPSGRYFTA